MNGDYSAGYISIVGYNYLTPIGALLEKLYSHKGSNPNEVQSSPSENGYSVSLVVLNILMLESLIRRTQYLVGSKDIRNPMDFIKGEFPDCHLLGHLEELFVIRDVIVHNHVWNAQIVWDVEMSMRFISVEKSMGGDKKFDRVIDLKNRKTRQLGLNLFPTRINRSDVSKVMNTVLDFLLFLEEKDRNYVYITPQFIMIDGLSVSFTEYVRGLLN